MIGYLVAAGITASLFIEDPAERRHRELMAALKRPTRPMSIEEKLAEGRARGLSEETLDFWRQNLSQPPPP